MKKLLKFIPEIYFMGLGIFWAVENYYAGKTINYIALLLVWLLFLQLFYKNRILGLVYGVILSCISAYMMLAVSSEAAELGDFTAEALNMQFAGWTIFGIGLIMSGIMVYRFATEKENYNEESVLTVTY
ncbi:hypothetical protein [uncultured Flavobacterium sp.]|uniref:hypothetical protein n=1 Tax=uncultured Flavobacterium sp. TaxID=165435 RepID=UPI0025EFF7E2|nr:hypothetical protein [uncultured Flavobacterium sp.]